MIKNIKVTSVALLSILTVVFFAVSISYSEESVTARENIDKLIKTRSCKGCDLAEVNLNRVDLSDVDLEGADLSQAKMYLTNLSRANLRNADLRGIVFGGADLAEADLRGADLRGTSLDGAYLGGTLLDGMFVETKPYEKDGVEEIVKEVYIDNPARPKKKPQTQEVVVAPRRVLEDPPPVIAVEKADNRDDIAGADISDSSNATLSYKVEEYPKAPDVKKMALVKNAIVEEKQAQRVAEIQQDKVEKDTVAGLVVTKNEPGLPSGVGGARDDSSIGAMASGSRDLAAQKKKRDNLSRLLDTNRCFGCDLSDLDLSNKNLEGADLEKADLTGSNLEKADLEEANLKGAKMLNTNIRRANLKKADLYKADLTGADLSGANIDGALFDNAIIADTVGMSGPGLLSKE